MSRAFVKDNDDAPDEPLPDRTVSEHPNYVTPRGLAQLGARREQLEAERLELARRAESEDDDSAADRLRYVDRDLRYYQRRLETAIEIGGSDRPADVVNFGAMITVREPRGAEERYTIVGEDETAPEEGLVSWVSPLGSALGSARVGQTVTLRRPAGALELTVVAIDHGR
jgi:transcription elongation GreA/GreB family factor